MQEDQFECSIFVFNKCYFDFRKAFFSSEKYLQHYLISSTYNHKGGPATRRMGQQRANNRDAIV